MKRNPITANWGLCGLAGLAALAGAQAGLAREPASGDEIVFPETYAKGVLYTTVDRADIKQYRELYATADTIDAVKAGKPIPSGTVLTLLQFKAKLDGQGNPEKDSGGRFVKGDLIGYVVMEKRTGWGTEHADDVRNGEWEYQVFTADKAVNDKAVLKNCFVCHKPLDKQDYVFSFEAMKTARR